MKKIENLNDLINEEYLVTHDGPCHADDVLSIALLRTLGSNASVLRTRKADVVKNLVGIDVAGSETGGQFDHHGSDAEPGVCALTKLWAFVKMHIEDKFKADRFEQLMCDAFIAVADIDSGNVGNPEDRPNMFGWIHLMNDGSDEQFEAAVSIAEKILNAAWGKAEEYAMAVSVARSAILCMGDTGVPVFELDSPNAKEALWQLCCDSAFFVAPHGDEWVVCQTCPNTTEKFNPFGCSRYLPEEWAGLRGEELQRVSGYASASFAFAPAGKTVMAFFGNKSDAIAAANAASGYKQCSVIGGYCPFGCDPDGCVEADTDGDENEICLRIN